jgi:hypothetical protein
LMQHFNRYNQRWIPGCDLGWSRPTLTQIANKQNAIMSVTVQGCLRYPRRKTPMTAVSGHYSGL